MPSIPRVLSAVPLAAALLPAGSGTALSQAWTELTPAAGAPSGRGLWSAVHDSQRHRVVLFGGQNGSGMLNEVWAFDLASNTWADLTPAAGPAPAPRRTPNSVYDPIGDRLVTWSGQGGGFFNDAWAFDFATNAWSELAPTPPLPNPRYGVASIWDPAAAEMVSFAGFTTAGRFQDTWRLNPATETWTEVTPPAGNPAARCLHSASYDAACHRMIMYGGQISGPTADIWAFDLVAHAWTELTPAVSPIGRWFAPSVYDAENHRIVVFGGDRGALQGGVTDEVQLFHLDRNEWQELVVAGTGPTARSSHAAVYVPGEDRMVILGGWDGSTWLDEVWSLGGLSDAVGVPVAGAPVPVVRAYPNPFRSAVTIEHGGAASVAIHDVAGRRVRTIRTGAAGAPGSVTWDGRDDAGRPLPAGVYWSSRLEEVHAGRAVRLVLLR